MSHAPVKKDNLMLTTTGEGIIKQIDTTTEAWRRFAEENDPFLVEFIRGGFRVARDITKKGVGESC